MELHQPLQRLPQLQRLVDMRSIDRTMLTDTVADFGLALLMPYYNERIAEDYDIGRGTHGNRAPEQLYFVEEDEEDEGDGDDEGEAKMMSSKTNVWAVGLVMWSLIVSYS
jgi:hypothetical protein